MKRIIIIISFFSNFTFAQKNLVPNSGFQEGPNDPKCNSGYKGHPDLFNEDIEFWQNYKPSTYWEEHSADWEGPNCSFTGNQDYVDCNGNFPGDRFVSMGSGPGDEDEGIKVQLSEELKAGHQYVFRCWARFPPSNTSDKKILM